MTEKPRPILVHYLTQDARNVEAMLNVLVSIDGQRMSVGEAVRHGLMVQTVDGSFTFDAKRCREPRRFSCFFAGRQRTVR